MVGLLCFYTTNKPHQSLIWKQTETLLLRRTRYTFSSPHQISIDSFHTSLSEPKIRYRTLSVGFGFVICIVMLSKGPEKVSNCCSFNYITYGFKSHWIVLIFRFSANISSAVALFFWISSIVDKSNSLYTFLQKEIWNRSWYKATWRWRASESSSFITFVSWMSTSWLHEYFFCLYDAFCVYYRCQLMLVRWHGAIQHGFAFHPLNWLPSTN